MTEAFEAMCRLLQGRDHSERELRTKLSGRFSPSDIDAALNQTRQRGLLVPPEKLSENFARICHRRYKGHLYIQNKLKQKGLPLLDKDTELEQQKAQHLLQKWQSALSLDKTSVNKKGLDKVRLSRRLMTRGFEYDTIKQVLRENTHTVR